MATTTNTTRKEFSGRYQKELQRLAELIDWLWEEHGKSFVQAGDDQVFAFGGLGYIIVFDESRWGGLVELITPKSTLTFKPGDDGKVQVVAENLDEKIIKQVIDDGVSGLRNYYENRYWSTPQ